MFKLFFSNYYEQLSAALLKDLEQTSISSVSSIDQLFTSQNIIVPHPAIRRRIELDYAKHFGICTQLRFSYLNEWLLSCMTMLRTTYSPTHRPIFIPEAFNLQHWTWGIYKIIEDALCLDTDQAIQKKFSLHHHARLSTYLKQSNTLERYEFSKKIARIFYRYFMYRPEWFALFLQKELQAENQNTSKKFLDEALSGLSRNALEDLYWQSDLWRCLTHTLELGQKHPGLDFLNHLQKISEDTFDQSTSEKKNEKNSHKNFLFDCTFTC